MKQILLYKFTFVHLYIYTVALRVNCINISKQQQQQNIFTNEYFPLNKKKCSVINPKNIQKKLQKYKSFLQFPQTPKYSIKSKKSNFFLKSLKN